VLAFAARFIEEHELDAMSSDPMALTQGLTSVGMAGIIDPLRAEAKSAFRTALGAGIDVRMITGGHAVTAEAIAEMLGLGPGVISGPQLQALPDEELVRRLPQLHVFGRVSPEDKLRLARSMQQLNRSGRPHRAGHRSRLPAAQPADPGTHRLRVAGLHRSRARTPDRDRSRQVDPSIVRAPTPRDRPDASGHTRTGPHRRE
jgi:hypothetical protein